MSDSTQKTDRSTRTVAKVIADYGPCAEAELVRQLMERTDATSARCKQLVRTAMMEGRVYQDGDDQYCRTGFYAEPGWEDPK